MLDKIKNRIEKELSLYLRNLNKSIPLRRLSPLIFNQIREFALREGKRVRPTLFILGYLGFAKKNAGHLYTSALSLELMHDFFLIHDDIIDKSELRRGRPAMHTALNRYLARYRNLKFNGEDLAIVAGDIMYALALHAFLSIDEEPERKERALKKLIETTVHTGNGELIELLLSAKDIKDIKKMDIYRIYDLKTAIYTFSGPLSIGATLAGADARQIDILFKYGAYLGRAFQIKDDVIGLFCDEKKIGKPALTDLQEAKKTILIWHAFNHATKKDKTAIKGILSKEKVNNTDLLRMRKIVIATGALDYAKEEISRLIKEASLLFRYLKMKPKYKSLLSSYSEELLNL